MGFNLHTYLSDPNDLKIFFLKSDESCNSPLYDFLKPILGNSVFSSSGKSWQIHRNIVSKCFDENLFEKYLVTINQKADILNQYLKLQDDGKVFDVFPNVELYVTTVVLELVVGIDVNPDNHVQQIAIKQLHKYNKK